MARGWCRKHYMRWWLHGDPLYVAPPSHPDTCTLPDCDEPYKAKGYCNMHYRRFLRTGDATFAHPIGKYPRAPFDERFWRRVEKSETCWYWTGHVNGDGYGKARLDSGRWEHAHRVSFRLCGHDIPDGHEVHHLCRVRHCVNPAHLEALSVTDHRKRKQAPRERCVYGHPLSGHNLYVTPAGRRQCRECGRRRNHEHRLRKKAAST